ncbi:porphobilinogen deaminase [mine drainage metagenome]|uniref:hydroxymethylbilane synthase n=1 Tax=mine drainage metagenome TaxID=410659 RepID=A0A1J5TN79_9ZZZZ
MSSLVIATRKSPLALAQTEMVAAHLRAVLGVETRLMKMVTTGDRQTQWSLEQQGGKGLFTKELEQALLRGEADIAVHSTKDLPGEMPEGLAIAGYMPRADARDVLVRRVDTPVPATIATGSPRRRLQLATIYPRAVFSEIRGNVDTRLRKIASDHVADATMLAAAGLARLGIASWPDLEFVPLPIDQMVPAVGQAAIGIQCRAGEESRFARAFDSATARAVVVERALQTALGGGCHTAFAAHVAGDSLHVFHESCGRRRFDLTATDFAEPDAAASRVLHALGLR